MILSRPSTAAFAPNASYTGADTFGDKFMLVGQVYDKSDVAKLKISAASMDGRTAAEGVLENVPQNIRLTKDFLTFSTDEKQQFYKKLYGSNRDDRKKQFRYKIRVWDSAKEYTTPDKPSVSTSTEGNSTDIYYLSNDLYDKVLSKHKIQTVYAMLNGTYSVTADKERSAADIEADLQMIKDVRAVMEDAKIRLGGSGARTGTFALYPSLNPRFDVPGIQPAVKPVDDAPDFPQLFDGSSLRVKLSQNLDEDPLRAFPGGGGASSAIPYHFYVMDWDVYKNKNIDQSYDINMHDAASDPDLIEFKPIRVEPEGGNYLVTLPIKKTEKLKYGHRYVLLVKGTDRKDHPFIADQKESGGTLYGMQLVKNEQKPEVTVVNINGQTDKAAGKNITEQVFIKKGADVSFTVQAVRATQVTYQLKDGTAILVQATKTITELNSTGGTVTIPAADTKFNAAGGSYKLVVKAENPDTGLSSIEQTYHLLYDVKGPQITIAEPAGGVIEGDNGKNITIHGTAVDTGIGLKAANPVTVTLIKDNDTAHPCEVIFEKNGENWKLKTIDLSDTTKYGQGEYTLTVTATDALDQTNTEERTFIYDEEAPVISGITVSDEDGSNSVAVDLSKGVTVYKKTDKVKIKGKVTESYGLKTFTIKGEDVGITTSQTNPVTFEKDFTLQNGSNPITINLIDKADRSPRSLNDPAFTVLVDKTKPELAALKIAGDDHKADFEANGSKRITSSATPVPIDGSIKDNESGIDRVQYQIQGETVWHDLIVSSSGEVSGSIPIANNSIKLVTLRATDRAGNIKEWKANIQVSSKTVEIQLDVLGTSNTFDTDAMKYRKDAFSVKIGASLSILTEGTSIPVEVKVFKDGNTTAIPNTDFFATEPNIVVKKLSDPTECAIKSPLPANGEYKIQVSAAGGSKAVTVMIDTKPPELIPRVPAEGQALREAQKLFAAISDIPGIGIESVTATLTNNTVTDEAIILNHTGSSVESATPLHLAEGPNTIKFKYKDKLGNQNETTVNCSFDKTPPVLSDITINGKSGEKVWIGVDQYNRVKPITIKGKVRDSNMLKEARLTVTKPGTEDWGGFSLMPLGYFSNMEEDCEWNIPVAAIPTVAGRYVVTITAEDAAGLTTSESCSFEVDSDKPTVSITAPASTVTVNKTVVISGTASDKQQLKSVKIVKADGSKLEGVSESKGDSTSKAEFTDAKASSWSFKLNTVSYVSGRGPLALKAIATDAVGNTKEEPFTVTVDQNSDRPVVTVTSFSKIEEDKANLVGTRIITGKVEDDDGAISAANIKIRVSPATNASGAPIDPSGSFAAVTATNGVWRYTIPADKADGKYHLDFELRDAAATADDDHDGEIDFNFKTLNTNVLDRPYVMGYEDTLSVAKDQNIVFRLDTVQPEFKEGGVAFVLGSAFSGSGRAITPNTVIGNNASQYASFRVFVKDASGIKKVELKLNNGTAIAGVHTSTADAEGYEAWDFSNVQLVEGAVSLAITATDNANFEKTWQQTIITDYTAPVVTIQDATLHTVYYKNADIIGGVDDSGTGISGVNMDTIQYQIGNSGWLSDKHTVVESGSMLTLSELKKAGQTWKVVIPDISKYKNGRGATPPTAPSDKIYKLPIKIKVKDTAGNEKELSDAEAYQVKFDPNGSTPIVELISPDASATLGTTVTVSGLARKAKPDATGTIQKIELQLSRMAGFTDPATSWILDSKDYGTGVEFVTNPASYWSKNLDTAVITAILNGADSASVWLRVRGVSSDGATGEWTTGRKFTISKDVAEFRDIQLVANGVPENYGANRTWIKGDESIIKGTVTHSSGIKNTIKAETVGAGAGIQSLDTSNTTGWFTERADHKGYDFAIKIKTSGYTKKAGYLEFTISAEDNRTLGQAIPVQTQIRLKYDNSVPAVALGTPIIKGAAAAFSSGRFTSSVALDDSKKDYYRVIVNNTRYEIASISGTTVTLSGSGASDLNGSFDYAVVEQPKILQGATCQIEGVGEDLGSGIEKVVIALTVNGATKSVELKSADSTHPIAALLGDLVSFKGTLDTTTVPNGEGTLKVTAYDGANNEISDQITTIRVKNNPLTISKLTFRTDLDGNGNYTAFDSDETYVASLSGAGNGLNADQDFRGSVNVAAAFTYKNNNKSELQVELTGGYNTKRYLVLYKDAVADGNVIKSIGIKPSETSGTPVTGNTQTFDLKDLLDDIGDGDSRKLILRAYDESVNGLWFAETEITAKVEHADNQNPAGVIAPFFYNADKTRLESIEDFKLTSVKYDESTKQPLGHIEIAPIASLGATHQHPCVSGTVILRGIAYDNVRLKELTLSGGGITVSNTATNGSWNPASALKVVKNSYSRTGHYVEWEYEWQTGTPTFDQTLTLTIKDSSDRMNGSGRSDPAVKTGTRDIGDNRSLTIESGQKAEKFQFLRFVDGEKSYLIQISDVDASGTKIKWTNVDVPISMTNYKLYELDSNDTSLTVNIVPYIMKIGTRLSKGSSSYPSTVNRTTLGLYPISRIKKGSNWESEKITVEGFNLSPSADNVFVVSDKAVCLNASNTSVVTGASTISNTRVMANGGTYTIDLSDITKSGYLSYITKAGSTYIAAVNNINSNDRKYHLEPNKRNNDRLDDDRYLKLLEGYQVQGLGEVRQLDFAINGNSLNFSAGYEDKKFSIFENVSGTMATVKNLRDSYTRYFDNCMAYNTSGTAFTLSACGDTLGSATSFGGGPSKLALVTGAAPEQNEYAVADSDTVLFLESNYNGAAFNNLNRFQWPDMVVTGNDSATKGYISYYDSTQKLIKFRYFESASTLTSGYTRNSDFRGTTLFPSGGSGNIHIEQAVPKYHAAGKNYHQGFVAIAGSDANSPYSAVAVTGDGTAVVTWYDAVAGALKLKYNTAPAISFSGYQAFSDTPNITTISATTTTFKLKVNGGNERSISVTAQQKSGYGDGNHEFAYQLNKVLTETGSGAYAEYDPILEKVVVRSMQTGTTSSIEITNLSSGTVEAAVQGTGSAWIEKTIDTEQAGKNPSIAVDRNNGLHIAYNATGEGDLRYAYVPSVVDSEVFVSTVDSYQQTGAYTDIAIKEIQENSTTYIVPYISYFTMSLADTRYSAKVAVLRERAIPTTGSHTFSVTNKINGAENELFTGKWEVMHIPSGEIPVQYRVNIEVAQNGSVYVAYQGEKIEYIKIE